MTGLRAIMVAVDYDDLLSVTLPYNRHHFSEVMVVTGTRPADDQTEQIAKKHGCRVHRTSAFWHRGASFNKWAALEEGLDKFGREGWFALLDADVLWPREAPLTPRIGELWSPLRRMAPWPFLGSIPAEREWASYYSIHRNVAEWAGYSQIFHASDPVLPPTPWHQVDWRHAGGADSFFQQLWPPTCKVRPSWEVLHLGPAGENWYGRTTPMADGTVPADASEKKLACARIWQGRRVARSEGTTGDAVFRPERLDAAQDASGCPRTGDPGSAAIG